MALLTAGDLVNYAFRTSGVSGVGQTATSDDFNDAMTTLQAMVAQWQRKRWLVWDLVETAVTSTGATAYTIGTAAASTGQATTGSFPTSPVGLAAGTVWSDGGVLAIIPGGAPIWPALVAGAVIPASNGVFAVARPDRIEAAFVRFVSTSPALDYPIGIIESREDYNRIALKTMGTLPQAVFYDAAWPIGSLYFWPVPAIGAYELHIFTKATLPTFANPTDLLNVPPEYIEALKYGLVVHLTMDWGLDPKPAHVAALKTALNTIRMANTAIAELRLPGGLAGRGRVGTDRAGFTSGWR